jgi:hypothetical protein
MTVTGNVQSASSEGSGVQRIIHDMTEHTKPRPTDLGLQRSATGARERATRRVRLLTSATGVTAVVGAAALTVAVAGPSGASSATSSSVPVTSTSTTTAKTSSAPTSTSTAAPATTTQQPVARSGGS